MQAHWLQWSSIADTERSYIVVFDQSTPAVTAELKRMAPDAKPATVPRVRGFLEFLKSPTKLGNVQAAVVDAATYSTIMEKFDFKRITVKVGAENRTGFIPIPRPTTTSEGTPANATPAATGAGNASGNSTGGTSNASKTSNTAGANATKGANAGSASAGNAASKTSTAGANATKGAGAGSASAGNAASKTSTAGATKGGNAGGATATSKTGTASGTASKTSGTAAKGKGTDRS